MFTQWSAIAGFISQAILENTRESNTDFAFSERKMLLSPTIYLAMVVHKQPTDALEIEISLPGTDFQWLAPH